MECHIYFNILKFFSYSSMTSPRFGVFEQLVSLYRVVSIYRVVSALCLPARAVDYFKAETDSLSYTTSKHKKLTPAPFMKSSYIKNNISIYSGEICTYD